MTNRLLIPVCVILGLFLGLGIPGYVVGQGVEPEVTVATEAAPTAGGTSDVLEVVGQLGGEVHQVEVQGNYGYVGQGPRLVTVDLSDPAQPVAVAQSRPLDGSVSEIALMGGYAYVVATNFDGTLSGNSTLYLFDLSDPTHPQERGAWQMSDPARDVVVAGSHAYVVTVEDGVQVLDVSNPDAPNVVATAMLTGATELALGGGYLYVASGYGLEVVDISDPLSPTQVSSYMGGGRDMTLAGSYLYTVGEYGMRVLDVTDPLSLTHVGTYAAERLYHITVAGDYAYISQDTDGMLTLDVSTPTQPTRRSFYAARGDGTDEVEDVAAVGGYVYVAASMAGLRVLDGSKVGISEVSYTPLESVVLVEIEGSRAYVGGSQGVRIFDISSPGSVLPLGIITPTDYLRDVEVVGTHAYLVEQSGALRIYDVSNPAAPASVGSLTFPGEARNVVVSGTHAFLNGSQALYVVDVSVPSAPTLVTTNTSYYLSNLAIQDSLLYLTTFDGLAILDISQPATPTELGSVELPAVGNAVAVGGDHAYVAAGGTGLQVIDVSDPNNPVRVGHHPIPFSYSATDVAVAGNRVFLKTYDLRVYDVSDPAAPTLDAIYKPDSFANVQGFRVMGAYAYVAVSGFANRGLAILDVSDPSMEVGHYDGPDYANSVTVADSLAFVSEYRGNLSLLDVSSSAPEMVGGWETFGTVRDVEVVGSHAYVVIQEEGLYILDISDPATPILVGSYLNGYTTSVAVAGQRVYLTHYSSLRVLDISNPAAPVSLGVYSKLDGPNDVAIAGSLVYVADGNFNGVVILDVSDPAAITEVGLTYGDADSIVISGTYAYAGAAYLGNLSIYDVSDPSDPTLVYSLNPTDIRDLTLSGNYLYGARGAQGISVWDVTNPSTPTLVSSYDTTQAVGVAVVGPHVYVADQSDGLLILRNRAAQPYSIFLPVMRRD